MFQHILIATDGSSTMSNATKYASTLFPNSSFHILSVINVSNPNVPLTDIVKADLEKVASEAVEREKVTLVELGGTVAKTTVVSGIPSKEIMKYVRDNHIELLVISRTSKECPAHLGGTCLNVLELAHCPLLLVPHDSSVRVPRTIFNPTSGSIYSVSASELAVLVADNFKAELHSLYVGRHKGHFVLRSVETMAQKLDVSFKGKEATGLADKEILGGAKLNDLMVISRGHAGFKYKMRKVSKKAALGMLEREVIGDSPIPMIIVSD